MNEWGMTGASGESTDGQSLLTWTCGQEQTGERFDRALADAFPEYSRTYLKELIDAGAVTVNGKSVKAGRKCAAGDEIVLAVPAAVPMEVLPEEMALDILYEDSDVLIVNKPKGLTVHPAPGHETGTLVNGVLAHCGSDLSGINGILRPGIVHRIDKDTSGALIVCKNDAAHRFIAEQLASHTITRLYLGITCGEVRDDEGTVTGNIGRSPRDRKKMAVVREGGKHAVTHYRVLERFPGYTYCAFRLETGRTHQIRVHMAHIGHPLLGDSVYGPSRNPFHIEGQVLHASVIGFIHPRTGEYMEFTAPLPEYFSDLLEHLRGGGR